MRYRTYQRKMLSSGQVRECEFDSTHFKEAGLPTMSVGMPQLEALELVNKWNREPKTFVYWLEAR